MRREAFETATRIARCSDRRPRALHTAGCRLGLGGDRADQRGALYATRVSEGAPQVVYSASLEEVKNEAQRSLKVNINTADVGGLDELPEVGPATAENIIEYRRTNEMFSEGLRPFIQGVGKSRGPRLLVGLRLFCYLAEGAIARRDEQVGDRVGHAGARPDHQRSAPLLLVSSSQDSPACRPIAGADRTYVP